MYLYQLEISDRLVLWQLAPG